MYGFYSEIAELIEKIILASFWSFSPKKTYLATQPQLRAVFPFRLTLLLMDFGHVKSEILAQLVSMQLKLGFLSQIIYAHWAKTSDMVSLIKTWLTH